MQEVKELIAQWKGDPCWDLENTEGFEAHREYLTNVQRAYFDELKNAHQDRMREKARELGCPDNTQLAAYVMRLERRLADCEQRLAER